MCYYGRAGYPVGYKVEPASHDPVLTVIRATVIITTMHTLYSVCEISISPKISITLYCILGIVCGRKLSQIAFIDVIHEKTFTPSPILYSSNNQLHKICDLVLADRQLRRQLCISIIDRPRLINALANSHTEQAFFHSYPCTQPRVSRPCFSVYLPPQIITEKQYGHTRLYFTG